MPGRRAPEAARREQIVDAAFAVARRTGIASVTLRAVAAEALLSHGLLLFHFRRKGELIAALLDRLLATTAMVHLAEAPLSDPHARSPHRPDRLAALLCQELDRLARDPRDLKLFVEYWALGVRDPAIRRKIVAATERYRSVFRTLAAESLAADLPAGRSAAGDRLTPDALAAVAVSLINGCAMQMTMHSGTFNAAAYRVAVTTLITRLSPPPSVKAKTRRPKPRLRLGKTP